MKRRLAALAAVSLVAALAPAWPARAQTVYEVEVGQDFFESAGLPGFSSRFYPGSIRIHKGDTIHFFGFGAPVVFPEGMTTAEALERFAFEPGDPYSNPVPDPDEGPDAWKFDFSKFAPTLTDCGTAQDPCEWNGADRDAVGIPVEAPDVHYTITANPGDVIYANLFGFSHDSEFRIEVVGPNEPASTQAELDARAAQLKQDDFDKAASMFGRYQSRQSSHRAPNGARITDVWVGVENGSVSLLGMFPRRVKVKRGSKVQFHFDYEGMEVHNAVFPKKTAKDIMRNTFVPVCDPDGDDGTAPDLAAIFDPDDPEAPPTCPEGAVLEFDLDPREINMIGNGVLGGGRDLEGSGARTGQLLQPSEKPFNESPWEVKFTEESPKGGWKYMCTIHGPLMSGAVIVP